MFHVAVVVVFTRSSFIDIIHDLPEVWIEEESDELPDIMTEINMGSDYFYNNYYVATLECPLTIHNIYNSEKKNCVCKI